MFVSGALLALSAKQVRAAGALKDRIDALQDDLNGLLGGEVRTPLEITIDEVQGAEAPPAPSNGRRRKKRVGAETRAGNGAAAKARCAARRMGKMRAADPEQPVEKPKRKMSAADRKAFSLAQKAKYARARRAAKSGL